MSSPAATIDWQQRFNTSLKTGLASAEAQARLQKDGYNELAEKKTNPLLKFLAYFWGPIPWMIEIAVILSALVGHWSDFGIILTLLVANAVVGFWEEYSSGNAIAALKAKLALQARVLRDGRWLEVPGRELVVGDVIRLRLGDIIPADAVLLGGDPLEVDQSALTGESLPVVKNSGDTVDSGSIVRQGEIDAVVSATGLHTYMGKTAELVEAAHSVSHFQKAVLKIGNYLIVFAVALVALILLFSLIRHNQLLTTLQFALVLTVAAVPVAMPTVLSVTMAVGARLLARKQAIVSKLASIEELAGMDVLCSDKTGTLTQNKLTIGTPVAFPGFTVEDVLRVAALASRAEDEDPIDLAVLKGLANPAALKDYKVTRFVPFDPVNKRTEADVSAADGKSFQVAKGAPQTILALVADPNATLAKMNPVIDDWAAKGFRALGVARKNAGELWQYLGLIPMFDPPRTDSKSTLADAVAMGVRVKMVTGDQLPIAREMALQLGIGTNILDAGTLGTGGPESAEETTRIDAADGFAQVFPEHKYRIVEALQNEGHIVGMTGDGVNDAPALKKADCGIAVSNATDAARAAADIVLLTPGLSIIIEAMKESRRIFQRMNHYAIYRIAETIRVLLFMTLSILVFNFFPVTAIMIVLLALLNDGAILSIAYDRAVYAMHPEAWRMKRVLTVSTVLGVVGVIESFGMFYLADQVFALPRDTIQTLMYLKLSIAGHMTVFVARTEGPLWSVRPANILLAAVAVTQLVATIIAVFGIFMAPIGWKWAMIIWGYAAVWMLIEDFAKRGVYRIESKK